MEIVHENTSAKIICHTPCYKASAHSFHWHENYEICQVLHNPCRFLIDGRPVQADEGDILAIDDYSVHRFLIDHDDTRVRILQFPAKLLLNADVPILPLRPHIPAAEIRRIANLGKTVDSLLSIIEQEDSL